MAKWSTLSRRAFLGSVCMLASACSGSGEEVEDEDVDEAGQAVAQAGLLGEYFSDTQLKNRVVTRRDNQVNFDWGSGSPIQGIASDRFSVRWTGTLHIGGTGVYTLYTVGDDGIRLFVDDRLVIDDWSNHGARERGATVSLAAGPHKLRLEYYEEYGSAVARLLWSSASFSKQAIPASAFVPPNTGAPPPPPPPPPVPSGSPAVFAGPFPSWINVKSRGAKGDGVTDDTTAIQNAISSAAKAGQPYVVYFPAGNYRITRTLSAKYQHLVVYGEDPATTKLSWAGASGADMILANGVSWSTWGRLTLEGNGAAGGGLHFRWDDVGPGEYSTQGVSVLDMVFRRMGKGIIGGAPSPGNMDSDIGIFRTRFESCSIAGLSTESWNALDYWVFDSAFVDNARGATNRYGSGNFNIHNSYFSGSTVADVDIDKNAMFLGLHGNTSIGSKQFLHLTPAWDAYGVILQDNRIIDTTSSIAIEANYLGDLILLDNQIHSRAGASGPAVSLRADSVVADFLSMGNKYTVTGAESVTGPVVRAHQIDNDVVARNQIDATAPVLPSTPPRATANVIDVPVGASTSVIQAAIDQAATKAGKHPVVHLPAGEYFVTQSLVVPPNVDVTITGDGWGTIVWGQNLSSPVFRLRGPSSAVIADMKINASRSSDSNVVTNAEGILVENADQVGARVYGEVSTFLHDRGTDLLVDRLANGHVDVHGAFFIREGNLAAHAIGVGAGTRGRLAIFGGTSNAWRNPAGAMFRVSSGGQMVVKDFWYEANSGPTAVRLASGDSGNFTFAGGLLSQYSGLSQSTVGRIIDVGGFAGRATFLGMMLAFPDGQAGRFPTIHDETSQTQVLATGMSAKQGGARNPYLVRQGSAPTGTVSFASNKLDTESGTGNISLPNSGNAITPTFLRNMLEQTRATVPTPFRNAPAGVTNVGLLRLTIQYATNGVHVVP